MIKLNSYAKLNLYLAVLNKRSDNYHSLITIFERIDLCDKIILKAREDSQIKIITKSSDIPKGKKNLAWVSAKLLQDNFKINLGVDIEIIKNIPVASGMAGGSSNAASVLIGLNKLWGLNLSQDRLARLAKKVGADVPFFIFDTRFALGKDRGDRIKPLGGLGKVRLWHILVVPNLKVSTPAIFKKWDQILPRARLTMPKSGAKLLYLAIQRNELGLIAKRLFNSLEQATFQSYPHVGEIKAKLADLGVKSILMSGSGPAVFGILSSRKEATALVRQLKRKKLGRIFVTRTV